MRRFDHPLRHDNVLFALSLVIAAAFVADEYLTQEHRKEEIAQAAAWRRSGVARTCPAPGNAAVRSDASEPCLPQRAPKR